MKRTMYNLLFVEDETMIRQIAINFLRPYFAEIYEAKDGVEALSLYKQYKPDIIITDIEMPNMDGLTLCKTIREEDKTTPIVITTAYTTTDYLLQAVELNLIKYLVKPVMEEALFEALESSISYIDEQNPSVIKLNKTDKFDLLNHTLIKSNELIRLTESQHKLLAILVKNQGRIVSYEELENHIWYDKSMSPDALRSLVRDLRKIIGKETIVNISKYGYRIQLHG